MINHTAPLLHLDNISMKIGKNELLKDFSLSVPEGSITYLPGKSGEGKSLLLKSLLGLAPSHLQLSGKIAWQKQKLSAPHFLRPYCLHEVAYVPQLTSALNPLYKLDHLFKRVWHIRRGKEHRKKDLASLLGDFSLNDDILRMYPWQLSGGMAKRVLFALALWGRHLPSLQLIIADEMGLGLDELLIDDLLKMITQIQQKNNVSFLLTTHDPYTLQKLTELAPC